MHPVKEIKRLEKRLDGRMVRRKKVGWGRYPTELISVEESEQEVGGFQE